MRLSLFLIVLFSFSSVLSSQPKLSLNAGEIYLGKIISGETAKGKIILTNIGNDSLIIYHVQPTCGCTAVKQPKKALRPKEADTVEIEFHSAGYQGHVTKYVNIQTNDPSLPYTTVKLIADVDEILVPEPRVSWFGEIEIGNSVTRTITVTNSSGAPLMIKNIIASSPQLKAVWKKVTLQANEKYTLEVTVQPKQEGFRNEYVWIETNHPKQPRYEIRLSFIGRKPQ